MKLKDNIFDTELKFLMTPERRFRELCEGLIIKTDDDKYPNIFFWFKGTELMFSFEENYNSLWVNSLVVWDMLEYEFELRDSQISTLIINSMSSIYKLENVNPWVGNYNTHQIELDLNKK